MSVKFWLFIVFLGIPLIEIALFIQIGGILGLWATLAVVILTAILGTGLFRAQGFFALREIRSAVERGQNPSPAIAHTAMIVIAGVLLLTPGFFTDAVGFALMTPFIRTTILNAILAGALKRWANYGRDNSGAARRSPGDKSTIDIETDYRFEEDGENSEDSPKNEGDSHGESDSQKSGDSGWTKP